MCNRALPDSIPFFPAVYHDYVAQFGLYVYEPEIKARLPFRSKEAMLFQFGGQLGWHGTDWSQATHHREKFFWLNTLASYRQLGLDWLAYGDMLRPPQVTLHNNKPVPLIAERWTRYKSEVETEQPAVTTSAWQSSDGRIAVFVLNVSDQKLNVRVRLPAAAKDKKLMKFYNIGPDYEYGRTMWELFKTRTSAQNPKAEFIGEQWPKLFAPDYSSYINAILAAKPDAVFCTLWGGDLVAFIKQAKPFGLF
ncbi:MAG: ABC transporter substrate-binding protein, partial [Verrucomicrobia bacterium]|nr:ABC transporter substrate-binding protein [Verrucomicrobiota bacterium]